MIRRPRRGRPLRDSAGRLVVEVPKRHRTALTLAVAALLVGGTLAGLTMAQASGPPNAPFGHVDSLTSTATGFQVKGWALDPDTTAPINVDVTADGRDLGKVLANASRPDVDAVYHQGTNHGFAAAFVLADGRHTICTYAINVGAGTGNTSLGCLAITLNHEPFGSFDTLTQIPGGFVVTGWTVDPDQPTTALTVGLSVGSAVLTRTAGAARPDVANVYKDAGPNHGFSFPVTAGEGTHQVCITANNVGPGTSTSLGCRNITLNFSPVGQITGLTQAPGGFSINGWATDPDTTSAIHVNAVADGKVLGVLGANFPASGHGDHGFKGTYKLGTGMIAPASHTICAQGVNYGSYGTTRYVDCKSISLNFNPYGHFESVTRASATNADLVATGWALDPDTSNSIQVALSVDGTSAGSAALAGIDRPDVANAHPGLGAAHGFAVTIHATDSEHRVCATAINTAYGLGNTSLGCIVINAVHPAPPSAPQKVSAVAGYGGATVTWAAPASDGGAPWSGYTVVASPGGQSASAAAGATSAVVSDLAPSTTYTFSVFANNVAGKSAAGVSNATKTQASPPAQTTPAPISTSRYTRNVRDASSAALTTMRNEGAADAKANPSGHGYLILLDIGGQDYADNGVVLSATTIFLSNADLVSDIDAYVDGYHSQQKASAPVTIALGTNNDMDVSSASGAQWAHSVVSPVSGHAKQYPGITIAGANDIEPGFRGTYAATNSWLSGYLGATAAPFVFNGSADGCSWTTTNSGCNNGWSMSGLYRLSAGASPPRILNLPQIYNSAMAGQWKFISLTGIGQKTPRIDFAGALTEWTACQQTGGCGSFTGNTAWQTLWNDLQSDARLKVSSLPYSTDLRIDR